MNWSFEIIDSNTGKVLEEDKDFCSESEANLYAKMVAKSYKYSDYYIRTFPTKEKK